MRRFFSNFVEWFLLLGVLIGVVMGTQLIKTESLLGVIAAVIVFGESILCFIAVAVLGRLAKIDQGLQRLARQGCEGKHL